MNDGLGAVRLTADWAVLGKHPGRVMGYEVLDGSLPTDRAKLYLWGATTGVPDNRDPAESLPWRVFLGSVRNDPTPVCAAVETTWDGSADGTGAPSYAWRLLLLEWPEASAAGLTWSALDQVLPREQLPASGTGVGLTVPRTPAADLAATADLLGFEWTARVAALLLDNQKVAITAPPGAALPDVAERVRILDAVCSLLPYGCRAWLSGATWTGQSEHTLRLIFAPTARTGQLDVWLGAGSPPEPQGAVARSYLNELLRLRAKRQSTTELIGHLLAATAVIPAENPAEALRVLRESDLLDSVIEEIGQGRGELRDVQRVLERYPVHSLGEPRLRVLVPFLARRALAPGGSPAESVLRQHWSPLTPQLLAQDVVLTESRQDSFARAKGYLSLMNAVEADHPGAFEELFTALVGAPDQDPGWTGTLIYMVENEFGRNTETADSFLIRSREAGLEWLRLLLRTDSRDLAPIGRLATRALRVAAGGITGWLRFAEVLIGRTAPEQATAYDAAEFTGAGDDAWLIALDIAEDAGRPAVIGLMWSLLRERARSREGQTHLLPALDRLAPSGGPGLTPGTAADADLLRALIPDANGSRIPLSMPRLRQITDEGALDAYAAAVIRRIETDDELKRLTVEALLGETPDGNSWQVLCLLTKQRPSAAPLVREGVDRRLTDNCSLWLGLALSDDLVADLSRREHLGWLRPVRDFRNAARAGVRYEQLARIIADASHYSGFSPQLLDEIIEWLLAFAPADGYFLAAAVDDLVPGLGADLYARLGRVERARGMCAYLAQYSRAEAARHHQFLTALGAAPRTPTAARPQQSAPLPQPSAPLPQPTGPPPQSASLPPPSAARPQEEQKRKRFARRFHTPDWWQGWG